VVVVVVVGGGSVGWCGGVSEGVITGSIAEGDIVGRMCSLCERRREHMFRTESSHRDAPQKPRLRDWLI
jgi:hypothetical protein